MRLKSTEGSDRCQILSSTVRVKDKNGDWIDKAIECGIRTSWKCDFCEKVCCHNHFGTRNTGPDESKHKNICKECQDKEVSKYGAR